MDDCAGDWRSTITWTIRNGHPVPHPQPEPDGVIHIDHHGASTSFTGEHRPPQGAPNPLLRTACTPLAADAFDIEFKRRNVPAPGQIETFKFEGTGVVTNPATREAHIRGEVRVKGGTDPGDTGTWESTRQGGVNDEDDKRRKGKDRKGHRRSER